MADLLPILYQQMADLTSPHCGAGDCGQFIGKKYHCCQSEYCEKAAEFALSRYGVTLQPTDNTDLPFMGSTGCVVPPYLRPLCTLHLCAISWAPKSIIAGDVQKTEEYFKLRTAILKEAALQGKEPF